MGLTVIERSAAATLTRRALGVSTNATMEEVVAASLRRAASVNCPTTPGGLTAAVAASLAPILQDGAVDAEVVPQVLERLVANGDLVESIDERGGIRRVVLYLGSPRFVVRANGDALLIGVRPDALPIVSEELLDDVDDHAYIRRLSSRPDLPELLRAEGLVEVKQTRWLRPPDVVTGEELASIYEGRLDAAIPSGNIEGLRILDPSTPTTYYRGRWRQPGPEHSGNYVARRGQRFGAELWAFVALDSGRPLRLLDLPAITTGRGCDEAWRLQAALDAANGRPQQIVVQGTGHGRVALGLHSPPPRWLQRRWELIGQPTKVPGALFAYDFAVGDVREEIQFASDRLWLTRHITSSEDSQ
jgi:hypothetical protein